MSSSTKKAVLCIIMLSIFQALAACESKTTTAAGTTVATQAALPAAGESKGIGTLLSVAERKTDGFPEPALRFADRVWVHGHSADPVVQPDRDYVSVRAYAFVGNSQVSNSDQADWPTRFWNWLVGSESKSVTVTMRVGQTDIPLFTVAKGKMVNNVIDPNKFTIGEIFGKRVIAPTTYSAASDLNFSILINQGKSFDSSIVENIYQGAKAVISAVGGPPAGLVVAAVEHLGDERGKLKTQVDRILSDESTFNHSFTFSSADLKSGKWLDIIFYEKSDRTNEIVTLRFVFQSLPSLLGDVVESTNEPKRQLSNYSRDKVIRVPFLSSDIPGLKPNEGTLGDLIGYWTPENIRMIEQAKLSRAVFEAWCTTISNKVSDSRFNDIDSTYALHAILSAVPYTSGPPTPGSTCPGASFNEKFRQLGLLPIARNSNEQPVNATANNVLDQLVSEFKGAANVDIDSISMDSISVMQLQTEYYDGIGLNAAKSFSPKDLSKIIRSRKAKTFGQWSSGEFVENGKYWRKVVLMDFDIEQAPSPKIEVLVDFIATLDSAQTVQAKIARIFIRPKI